MVTPASFNRFDEPKLICMMCEKSARFCSHIKHWFNQNIDLDFMWEALPIRIEIPISSDYDQWAQVEIFASEPTISISGKALVCWETIDITVISRGEGRKVIRDALINHMYGDYKASKECKSTGHTPGDQKIWENAMEVFGTLRVAQLWSVYTTGLCLPCNRRLDLLVRNEAGRAAAEATSNNVWNA